MARPTKRRTSPLHPSRFDYSLAFDRNVGWLTEWEQLALRAKRVAIAGLGGAGGAHLLTLARLGIGAFTIADFDQFDLVNFNRQAGATMGTLGRPKALVLEEMALAINPEARIRRFDTAITPEAIDDFLDGADLFADGLDFFEIDVRRRLFARCAERGIPAVTAAPIGMGVGFLAFDPRGMSFEAYFRFEGQSANEQFLRFLLGLAPAGLHRSYLVDPTRVDLARRKGPSTIAAIQLCAGVTASAAVKLLLGRGGVRPAPLHYQYDAYRQRLAITRLHFGNAGPLQRLKLAVARRQLYGRLAASAATVSPSSEPRAPSSVIEEILNLGRWAPSGDNTQPWRFRVLDDETVAVRLPPTPSTHIYEYRRGEPTLLAIGMLLETLRLAATLWERKVTWQEGGTESAPTLSVRFVPEPGLPPDPLASFITMRSVDRRSYRRRRLTPGEKRGLEACLGDDLTIEWHEGRRALSRFGALNASATGIRLRAAEAFPIHQRVLDWTRQHSPDRIPVGAIGLAGPTLPFMRWAMQRPERMQLANRLGGAALTAWQLDRWPALNSAAFFVIRGKPPASGESRLPSLLHAGAALQRLWLSATKMGLAIQPVLATLAFAEYGATETRFTSDPRLLRQASIHARKFHDLTGHPPGEVLFLGRIGEPKTRLPGARSTRLPLDQLIEAPAAQDPPIPR